MRINRVCDPEGKIVNYDKQLKEGKKKQNKRRLSRHKIKGSKSKEGGIAISNFQLHYKAVVVKWHGTRTNTHTGVNGTELRVQKRPQRY